MYKTYQLCKNYKLKIYLESDNYKIYFHHTIVLLIFYIKICIWINNQLTIVRKTVYLIKNMSIILIVKLCFI